MSTFPVHTGPRLYMSIHIGKIGRLPCTVREQINQRLRNGELAKSSQIKVNQAKNFFKP